MVDNSEKYIAMLEKVPREITEPISISSLVTREAHQKYRAQTLYCTLHKRFIGYDCTNCPMCGEDEVCEKHWRRLPRQGELQEMLIPKPYFSVQNLLSFFFDWVDWNDDEGEFSKYTSMEQLWLAFMMKEKYNKVWDGERWM